MNHAEFHPPTPMTGGIFRDGPAEVRPLRRFAAIVAAIIALLLPGGARGASILVNGTTAAQGFSGDPLTVAISGAPGKSAFLMVDLSPGPTPLYGQSLPLAFSPAVTLIGLGALPPSGVFSFTTSIPEFPGVDVIDLYLLAVVLDAAAPFGYDFSNGASLQVIAPPDAGANQGALIGRTVTLDGRSVADDHAELKAHRTVLWSFTQVPSGSAAAIQHPTSPFASFTPDVAGDYEFSAAITVFGLPITKTTTVHCWSVHTTPSDGDVLSGPFPVTGTLAGPPVPAILVDNVPVPVNPITGTFGPISVSFAPGEPVAHQELRIFHPDLSLAIRRQTFFEGTPLAPTTIAADPLTYVLRQPGIDALAPRAADYVEAAESEVDSELKALPNYLLKKETGPLGNVVFEAHANFLSLAYGNATVVADALSDRWDATVDLANLVAKVNVWGEVLGVPYNTVANVTSDPAEISVGLKIAVSGTSLLVDVVPPKDVSLKNLNFSMPGFIGTAAQLNFIQNAIREKLEDFLLEKMSEKVAGGYHELLSGLTASAPVLGTQVNAVFSGAFSGNAHSTGGLTLRLQTTATPISPPPEAPAVPAYRSTNSTNPMFGALAPSGGVYSSATAFPDDFLSQTLAAATEAGLLESTLPPVAPGGSLGLTAGGLAIIIPGAGFEDFDPATPITLRTHGVVAPTAQMPPAGPGHCALYCPNLQVSFEVDTTYGAVKILQVALDNLRHLALVVDADATLAVTMLQETDTLSVVQTLPGQLVALLPGGLLSGSIVLPQPVTLLGQIPFPSLIDSDLIEVPQESALVAPGLDHAATFGALIDGPG